MCNGIGSPAALDPHIKLLDKPLLFRPVPGSWQPFIEINYDGHSPLPPSEPSRDKLVSSILMMRHF
jgi:hypothetical protein